MLRLKVREVAQQKGVSQRQLVIRSGLDIRVVQRVMRDSATNITLITLDRLAKALDVDARELIEPVSDTPESQESSEA
ncbi:MAG: helix-turn-helix transcriptional regulator [Ktedonobacteraceae bacterium]|nr:helix-turn-helix transcriptional regulator [Ktedonobacteraceae bacterium]